MENASENQSPWWYRQRGSVIGAVYGLGFVLGYITIDGQRAQPAFLAWGGQFGAGNGGNLVLWSAAACALIAGFWRTWGTAYLHRDVVFASDVQSGSLIIAGPFRYVRNPLYLGNLFLALAVAVFAPPLGFIIILAGNVAVGMAFAAEESRQLVQRYGDTYEAFRRAVPAFLPRLTPVTLPSVGRVEPAWRSAFLGEGFCLALAVAIVPVAVFGQAGFSAFWFIWVSALVAFAVSGWWAGRTNGSKTAR